MATDLELALQGGGQIQGGQGGTDLDAALAAGGQIQAEDRGSTPFINRAIAGTLGAPVDLVTGLLNTNPGINIQDPIGGSQSITDFFNLVGSATAQQREEPKTLREFAGTGIGEAASFLIPFTKGAQVAAKGTGTTSRVSRVIVEGVQKHPILTGATEITAGIGTGGGRFAAETTDKPNRRIIYEIGGSLLGGFAPIALTYTPVLIAGRQGRTLLKRFSLPFTEAGAKFRAGEFIKRQVEDPTRAGVAVTAETIGSLPPAVASGEKRLVALYNQFRNADPVTDAEAIKKIGHSIFTLEQELRKLGFSAPEIVENVTRKRVASLQLRMDKSVADAMEIADNKLSAIPVADRQSREAIVVRDELVKVMKKEDAVVKEAWERVPKDIIINPSGTRTAYKELLATTPKAQRVDIPAVLKGSSVVRGKITKAEPIVDTFTGAVTGRTEPKAPLSNVKEMQGLRSKLLEVQRIARRDGQWNKARIAGDMADNLLVDMAAGSEDGLLTIALEATSKFKKRFDGGIVGKILGRSKTGEPSISPELTIDVSIGRSGIAGGVDIEKVVVTPEARNATKRYLSRSFTDFVTSKGTKEFDTAKAFRWVKNNEEVLDQFPQLRSQLQDAASARQHADNTLAEMTVKKKALADPRRSMTAAFLKSDPGSEIKDVFKAHNPLERTKDLIRKANKDTTGDALEGLKGSYVEYLIDTSSIGPFNEIGEQTISGKKLLSVLGQNHKVWTEMFTPEELLRINKIGQELVKVDIARGGGLGRADLSAIDNASSYLHMVSRVGGAQIGRWVASVTGGGTVQTPGIFSERFRNFSRHLTKDKAFELIVDSVTADDGGKLLKALLSPINKPALPKHQSNLKELNKRVNMWLIGTGARVLRDVEQERAEDEFAGQTDETEQLEALTGVQ